MPTTLGTRQIDAGAAPLRPKVAITAWSAVIVTMQLPAPEQSPDQPVKRFRPVAFAVSVTVVPPANAATHVEPQLIPAGELVTVPVPTPAFVTVSVWVGGGG